MSQFFLRSFPGTFSYHGEANICTDETEYPIFLNLKIDFSDRTEAKAIFEYRSRESRNPSYSIESELHSEANKIVLRDSFILIGSVISTTAQGIGGESILKGEFSVGSIVSLKSLRMSKIQADGSYKHEFRESFQEENTLHLKVYLNKRFSSYTDRIYATENNLAYPDSGNKTSLLQERSSNEIIYCRLNSNYSIRCGISYIRHRDESPFVDSNRELIYKLTFIEIFQSLKPKKDVLNENEDSQSYDLNQELQKSAILVNQVCAFLSLVRNKDFLSMEDLIHPLFLQYSVNYRGQFISGYKIPLLHRLELDSQDHARNSTRSLIHCLEAILECCPLNERFSHGLFSLSNSLAVNVSNTKLIAICSAIEYFFSYWIYELNGYEALQENEHIPQKLKRNLERSFNENKTPTLSFFLNFFLAHIGIDISGYRILDGEDGKAEFLIFRNDILHGKLIVDGDLELTRIVDQTLHLAIDIMVSLLKLISASDDEELYVSLKPVPKNNEYYSLLIDWHEIPEALSELYSTSESKRYWSS